MTKNDKIYKNILTNGLVSDRINALSQKKEGAKYHNERLKNGALK